jgi:hypothetical protein
MRFAARSFRHTGHLDPDGNSVKTFLAGLGRGIAYGAAAAVVATAVIIAAPVTGPALLVAAGTLGAATVAVEGYALAIDPVATADQKHEFAGEVIGGVIGAGGTAAAARAVVPRVVAGGTGGGGTGRGGVSVVQKIFEIRSNKGNFGRLFRSLCG